MGDGWPELGDPVLSDCDIDALAFVFAWALAALSARGGARPRATARSTEPNGRRAAPDARRQPVGRPADPRLRNPLPPAARLGATRRTGAHASDRRRNGMTRRVSARCGAVAAAALVAVLLAAPLPRRAPTVGRSTAPRTFA